MYALLSSAQLSFRAFVGMPLSARYSPARLLRTTLEFTHHHPLALLSVTPQVLYSKLKCYLFKNSYSDLADPLSSHYPSELHVGYTHLNSYSASVDPLATGR